MKTSVSKLKCSSALFTFVLALFGVMSAQAQGHGFIASSKQGTFSSNMELVSSISNDEDKEELSFKDFTIEIEEVATVTFINKMGEVVAVLKGDKKVLDNFYQERIAKSYFLSSYGIHEVYLLR